MKSFETSSRRGKAAVVNPIDIEFELDGAKLTAHPPTTGQLGLFIGGNAEGGMKTIQSLFRFLRAVLDDASYKLVEDKLQEGVEISVLTDIIEYLVAEWSGRPTTRSSASSPSRKTTGTSSTAKRRSTVVKN